MNEVKEKLTQYLSRFVPQGTLSSDVDLFASGYITSLSAMQLVGFVEHELGVTIENEDLSIDNFRTIDALSGLIERKRAV